MKRTTNRRRSPLAASLKATAATLAIVAVTGGWAAFSVAARQNETAAIAAEGVEIAAANTTVATAAIVATATTSTYTTAAATSAVGVVTETATTRTLALPTVTPTPPATATTQPAAQPTPTLTATPAPTATAVAQMRTESNTAAQQTRPAAVTRSSK